MSIDVTSIVSMHGQVYKDSGQGMKDLTSKFYQKSITEMLFGMLPTNETVKHSTKASISRVLQRFQKTDTPIGTLTVKAAEAYLTKLKVDVEEYPDDIEDTYIGFLASLDKNERAQWPFVKWWLNEHVMPQAAEDWELLEIYHGTQDTIDTPGTANAAGKNFIGIKKQINAMITATTLDNSTTTTGALSSDAVTFVEQIEAWWKYCKERSAEDRLLLESGQVKEICMSPARRDLFKEGMGEKYNTQYPQIDLNPMLNVDDNVRLHNSNVKIIGLPSMIGSDKIFASPTWNKYGYVKRPNSATYFQLAPGENIRAVKAAMDFWKAVGFWRPEYVYTNDLELV